MYHSLCPSTSSIPKTCSPTFAPLLDTPLHHHRHHRRDHTIFTRKALDALRQERVGELQQQVVSPARWLMIANFWGCKATTLVQSPCSFGVFLGLGSTWNCLDPALIHARSALGSAWDVTTTVASSDRRPLECLDRFLCHAISRPRAVSCGNRVGCCDRCWASLPFSFFFLRPRRSSVFSPVRFSLVQPHSGSLPARHHPSLLPTRR